MTEEDRERLIIDTLARLARQQDILFEMIRAEPRFEYCVTRLESGKLDNMAGKLNEMAADGWRLAKMFQAYGEVCCIFERRIRDIEGQ